MITRRSFQILFKQVPEYIDILLIRLESTVLNFLDNLNYLVVYRCGYTVLSAEIADNTVDSVDFTGLALL